MRADQWTVGKVAKRAGINVSALHFYEDKGLISSYRNAGNQRRYKPEVLRRLSIIKAAQKLGITLEEIKQAFTALPEKRTPTQQDWERLSQTWRGQLDVRIAYLTRLRDQLTGCIGCGCLSMKHCPLYNADDCLAKDGATGPIYLDKEGVPGE